MPDALGEVEEAISALGRGDPDGVRVAVGRAVATDPALYPVADALTYACSEFEAEGEVSAAAWNMLADACPPELLPAVESWRQ